MADNSYYIGSEWPVTARYSDSKLPVTVSCSDSMGLLLPAEQ